MAYQLPAEYLTPGKLRIPRYAASLIVPWIATVLKSIVPHPGKKSDVVRFSATATERLAEIGDKPEIVFNVPYGFNLFLGQFNAARNAKGQPHADPKLKDLFDSVLAGWSADPAPEKKLPPDEVARAKADCRKPYVPKPYEETPINLEPVKPQGKSLFAEVES